MENFANDVPEMKMTDPQGMREVMIRALQEHVRHIARRANSDSISSDIREKLRKEYHHTMAELYELGWEGTLPPDCLLPLEFMPRRYFDRSAPPPAILEEKRVQYLIDPVLWEHLCHLSGWWWLFEDDPHKRRLVVEEYHQTLAEIYRLGWDGMVDYGCRLPDEFMPEEFHRRNPPSPEQEEERRRLAERAANRKPRPRPIPG